MIHYIKEQHSEKGVQYYITSCSFIETFKSFYSIQKVIEFLLCETYLSRNMAEMVCYMRNLGLK